VPFVAERRYTGLRLLASTCIGSAWITLILSLIVGFGLLAAPVAPAGGLPIPPRPELGPDGMGGLGGGGLGGPGGAASLLPMLAGGLRWVGALTTIGGGVLSFFLLAALGQALYLLLDVEENTRITASALAQIARRMGGG
jgi:hypothetical protein